MADVHQTLFSFEIFVEYVRIDDIRKINIVEPAVAMRLLDFPTLLIYRSENADGSSKSGSEKVHFLSEASSYFEEKSFVYSFKKGKSCLFKINLNSLHAHLSNTPLYTMLLDVRSNIPKLIGNSYISLAKLTEHIKLDAEKRGIWTPAFYGKKVISSVLNLMGENVGAISLAYKIVSFGASLIPDTSESRLDEIGAFLKPNITSAQNNGAHETEPCLPENITSNAPSQPVCFDEQPTEVLLSETKATCVAAVTTQTEHIKKKDISVVTEVDDDDDEELLCSKLCPPPLFYSSSERNQQQEAAEIESVRMAKPNNKDTEDEKSAEMECANQINGPKGDEQGRLVSDVGVQHNHTLPSLLGDAILQLPLLNALIGELSYLSDQIHQQQHPFLVPPNLVRLCTSAGQPPASGNKAKNEVLKTAAPVQTVVPSLSPKINSHVPIKCQHKRPHHSSKLRYGLNHTFRLRLKQVNLDMPKQRECTELFKIKQLESQKKTSSKPENYNSTSKIFKRDQHECVGKLFGNLEIDPAPLKVISNLKKNTSACKTFTKQHMSSNSLNLNGFCYKSDKEVQVHIPSMLSQNSDHSDKLAASNNHTSFLYLNKNNCDVLSSRESNREDSRPCGTSYRPASSHDSVESEKYQDDFTSLDPTEGSLDPLSSPEPGRSRRGQVSSNSSSSGNSFSGNTSHPILVKMSHSPKQSLKGTHVIKPQFKTSVLSTSSDDIKGFPVSISTSSRHWQRSPESQSSLRSLNLSRNFKRSKSMQSDYTEESAPVREQLVDTFLPFNDFVQESVSSPDSEEERDELVSLGFENKYQPISDLMINKLPGYTL